MIEKLVSDRPVFTFDRDQFGRLLGRVLSPSRPLQSEQFLRGRSVQLMGIRTALFQPGRHVLIHGLRGVGKSSLAQTAAFSLAEQADPILIGCDRHSTLHSVIREIFEEADNANPRVRERVKELGGSFSRWGFGIDGRVSHAEGPVPEPLSTNDAVRLISHLSGSYAKEPVIVIDEFDLIQDRDEQERFATFIKQVSDRHVGAKFIFCGIGESVDSIMSAHGSADRYFHTVELGQLPFEAREEILMEAADAVGIKVDRNTMIRVARISDGFPHYVHFISEKLFWRVYEDEDSQGEVAPKHFELAMSDASEAMDMKLRGPYEKATQKYNDDYETVLWAAADGHELTRRSTDIFKSYVEIMRVLEREALDRTKFNGRINSLKKASHAGILKGSRSGWYEFSEKMIRGYVRLRAEKAGVVLDADHPAAQRLRERGQ